MSDNKQTGSAKKVAGKVEEGLGKVVGDTEMQARGKAKQTEGSVQKGVGEVEDAVTPDRTEEHHHDHHHDSSKT